MSKIDQIQIQELDHKLDLSSNEAFWVSVNQYTEQYKLKYFLSHQDDGVIWGVFENDWKLSAGRDPSPSFHLAALQNCRIFGPSAELFIWKNDRGIKSRLLVEGKGDSYEYSDRMQILFGDTVDESVGSFSLLREGGQGMLHFLPIPDANPRVGLVIRTYIDYDHQGVAYYRYHRLVGIEQNIQPKDYRYEG